MSRTPPRTTTEKLTPAERAAISARNGKRSRGPTSARGKANSSKNSQTCGYFSVVLPVREADRSRYESLTKEWADYYQPRSPAAWQCLERCVRAALNGRRNHEEHDQAVALLMERAGKKFDTTRKQQVTRLLNLLDSRPAAAAAGLRTTGAGCFALVERFERIAEWLADTGHLSGSEVRTAVHLCGAGDAVEELRANPAAYLLTLYNLHAMPRDPAGTVPGQIALLTRRELRPLALRYDEGFFASLTPEAGRSRMGQLIDDQIETLCTLGSALSTGRDLVQRNRLVNRCMLRLDPKQSRRYFRVQSQTRNSYHRAVRELWATLESDARAEDAAKSRLASPVEAGPVQVPTPAGVVFQNNPESLPEVISFTGFEATASGSVSPPGVILRPHEPPSDTPASVADAPAGPDAEDEGAEAKSPAEGQEETGPEQLLTPAGVVFQNDPEALPEVLSFKELKSFTIGPASRPGVIWGPQEPGQWTWRVFRPPEVGCRGSPAA